MTSRRIAIAVAPDRFLRWHQKLRDSLAARRPGAEVVFRFERRNDGQSLAITQLLAVERLLLRHGKPTLCDRLDPPTGADDARADVVVDLLGDATPSSQETLIRPLYDGHATDQAAVAALLAGAAPTIEIADAGAGQILARGLPSLEAADGLTGGLEAVYSRAATLIEKALAEPNAPASEAPMAPVQRTPAAPLSYLMRNLAFRCARAIYHLCCHAPHWRVGWRFTDGPGVLDAGALSGARWRPMVDRDMNFAADPFPVDWRGRSGVFYERLDYATDIGEIWYQPFDGAGPAGDPVPALKEKWHLSYPFLIEQAGALHMIPEASASGRVTLYRCVDFPTKWEPVADVLTGIEAADATIFTHAGRYWMTSVVRDGVGGYSDTLAIHHAPTLFGPWEPHAHTPVLIDSRFARPAGAVVSTPNGLYRPVQDCAKGYGRELAIMRIDALDPRNFRQSLVSRVTPGAAWPGARLHTINRAGRLECIDGAIFAPKYLPLRRLAQKYADRRLSERV